MATPRWTSRLTPTRSGKLMPIRRWHPRSRLCPTWGSTMPTEINAAAPRGVLKLHAHCTKQQRRAGLMDEAGKPVTQSQLTILKAAACAADTPCAAAQWEHHHALTQQGLAHIVEEEKSFGGALGRPSGARFKAFERLKALPRGAGRQTRPFLSPTNTSVASTG